MVAVTVTVAVAAVLEEVQIVAEVTPLYFVHPQYESCLTQGHGVVHVVSVAAL